MTQNKINSDEVGKTVTLAALLNTVLAPFWYLDTKLGLSAAVVATGGLIWGLHEIGEKNRPVANGVNRANRFFGGITGDKPTEVETALANISKGGEIVFDGLFKPGSENRP